MKNFLRSWLLLVALALALPVFAGMGITGANTPHTHADANTGGALIMGHITQHCTQLTASTNVSVPTATGAFSGFIKVPIDTIVADPDGMADTVNHNINTPTWAHWSRIRGHATFPIQNIGNGFASVHLFTNDSPTQIHYHVREFYPANPSALSPYLSLLAESSLMSVLPSLSTYQLYVWQDTGGTVSLFDNVGGAEAWLEVCFYP